MNVTLACTTEFMAAQERLPKDTRKKVLKFFDRYRANPKAPGFNFERIEQAASARMHSVRIDLKYRVIVHREKNDNTLICLWVDNHDEAYQWAHHRKVAIHPDTAVIQVFSTRNSQSVATYGKPPESGVRGLFAAWQDRKLRRLGLPEELIPLVRAFKTKADLDAHIDDLPEDAYIALMELADNPDCYEDLEREIGTAVPTDDYKMALMHPSAKRQFIIIDDDESLQRIMDAPLDEWRIYLHPTQRRLVEMNAKGPIRVLGGAGTGKTVVAMHRAKRLATEVFSDPEDRILFLVFSTNLVGDVHTNLARMCSSEVLARIEVINIDKWVQNQCSRLGFRWRLLYDDRQRKEFWKEAIEDQSFELGFSRGFAIDEFSAVVLANGLERQSEYLRISRRGRGKGLWRAHRRRLWKVFATYRALLEGANLREPEDALRELRKKLDVEPSRYCSVIVDEVQDFTAEAMRLVRTVAPKGEGNDLMIVGDAHQRIYGRPLVLSRCGINIRGRSHRLRINYRTPEEIRACAVSVLAGVPYDDLDGSHDTIQGYRSLIRGVAPEIRVFDSLREEIVGIVDHIKGLQCAGNLHRICVVVRTNLLVERYVGALEACDVPTFRMALKTVDNRSKPGVRVGTMHRVKGLEFDHVIAAGVNDDVLPVSSVLKRAANASAREEVWRKARSLLYVVCTRARKTLFLASHGAPSALLNELLERHGSVD